MDTLVLTSLLVSMGISTLTSKDFFCRVSKIGNDYDQYFPAMNDTLIHFVCFFYQTFDDHQ